MGRTNPEVAKAFYNGEEAQSSNGNMSSRREDGATLLYSYRQVIALRRDDGQVFINAHRFSPTTGSKHQTQLDYGDTAVSFTAISELMGGDWWRRARVMDRGPDYCRNAGCEQENADQSNLFSAGLLAEHPDYGRCWHPNMGDGHAVNIPGYRGSNNSAVLLSFGDGRQAICGEEAGKAVRYQRRTDQLWAALLPAHAYDIRRGFLLLSPPDVRRYEEVNVPGWPALHERKPVQRQGDLYFIPSYDGPPKAALKIDGVALPFVLGGPANGRRSSHIASRARLALDGGGAATIWARGNVDHHEHARLRLPMWHRVCQSSAVRAVSSPLVGAGSAYAD